MTELLYVSVPLDMLRDLHGDRSQLSVLLEDRGMPSEAMSLRRVYAAVAKLDKLMEDRSTFTDAEAAERLLALHARMVADHFDADNLHSAEELIKVTAKRFLERVAEHQGETP